MKFSLATVLLALPTALGEVAKQNYEAAKQNYKACETAKSKAMGYCDASLDIEARLDDLLSRLSYEEIVATMSPQEKFGNTCGCHTDNVERLDLPQYVDARDRPSELLELIFSFAARLVASLVLTANYRLSS